MYKINCILFTLIKSATISAINFPMADSLEGALGISHCYTYVCSPSPLLLCAMIQPFSDSQLISDLIYSSEIVKKGRLFYGDRGAVYCMGLLIVWWKMQVQKGNSVEFKCIIRFYIILVHLINQCNLQTGATSKWENIC